MSDTYYRDINTEIKGFEINPKEKYKFWEIIISDLIENAKKRNSMPYLSKIDNKDMNYSKEISQMTTILKILI